MNIRLCWLDPLLKHLKQDATLSDIGKFVFPMSHYRGITTNNQFSPSIWVIPQEGSRVGTPKLNSGDCKNQVSENILICSVVKNVIACPDHVGHELRPDTTTEVYGAYIEAADLEKRVRQSILDFNINILNSVSKFTALELIRLPEPDEHNGHFILGQIYQTTFSF